MKSWKSLKQNKALSLRLLQRWREAKVSRMIALMTLHAYAPRESLSGPIH